MKYAIALIGFAAWLFGCYAFNNGFNGVWLKDGNEIYTIGELLYQTGLMSCFLCFAVCIRWGVKVWWLRLIFNSIIEIFVICLIFTITDNPYHINWDEVLMCQISFVGMCVLYLICYLFKPLRRIII